MRLYAIVLSAILVLAFTSAPSFARQISAVEGMEALRRSFDGVTDFTAEFTQEKRMSLMKKAMVTSGTLRFKKPDLFLMEIHPPFAGQVLLRDNVIEQATGREGERNRIVLPHGQGLNQWISKLATPVKTIPEGLDVKADLTDSVYTLAIALQGKGQLKDISISFQQDGTLRRLVFQEQNGDRSILTLKKVRRNTGLSEKDFKF